MTTFDLVDAHNFAAHLDAGMDRCDDEGMERLKLDVALQHYTDLCCEFTKNVREWGREVFSGRVAFDPEVERLFKERGQRLYSRALKMWNYSLQLAARLSPPFNSHVTLNEALLDLGRLLNGWVTPNLAVGPSAKRWRYPEQAATEEERRRVASLPPLPADGRPDNPGSRAL
jgi:hypothetical protein